MATPDSPIPLAQTSNGRTSGKPWKEHKSPAVSVFHHHHDISLLNVVPPHRRSHLPEGVKTKQWEHRMEQTKRAQAIKKLQQDLKDEKQAEFQRRRAVTLERRKAAEEKRRLEEAKAKMGARRAARLRRRAGRTKKVNH
ncbi:hypothetical protein AGABI1DRAFT_32545 [Agaricus bisporus var. burnettii JB137-S8]|uniref:rRNA-processing protein n=1 Tax=Agaricus bisporus var. burnettii (strain JB137-S8 / ATCC MYA-4627 / FGSC 10392) TaxID=597362 RepID=K5XJR6_AGABU|nr:uncharacterized protein AGABI1DRAFT_32545 [Agaricus bisporus var. burnettii JB137-S8]EKM83572.1 hypothetical protein AGABI1DRAFT_32545 [Agaricus bisporus var. burnettii JB137-S8]